MSSSSSSTSFSSSSSSLSSSSLSYSSSSCYLNRWSDSFNGINGDIPSVHRWNTAVASGASSAAIILDKFNQNVLTIQNNKLNFSPQPSGYGQVTGQIFTGAGIGVTETFLLEGDFDVQLSFDSFQYSTERTTNTKAFYLQLSEYPTATNETFVYRIFNDDIVTPFDGYRAIGTDLDAAIPSASFVSPDTDGAFRITRVGGEWTTYTWSPTAFQWHWDGDTAGIVTVSAGTADVEVTIFCQSYSYGITQRGEFSVNIDNWWINSADGVTCPNSSSSSSVSSSSSSSSLSSSSSTSSSSSSLSSSSLSSSSSSSSLSSSSYSSSSLSSSSSTSSSSSSTSLAGALKHFWFTLRDDEGVPRGGELVNIYEAGTTTHVNIYDSTATSAANPITTSTGSSATEGVFEFYLKDEMWNNVSPSGYPWDQKIDIEWDHDGVDKSADRIMTWGDYHPIYDVPFDPLDFSLITAPTSADTDYNDKNKAISNSIACKLEHHRGTNLGDYLSSSSSSSTSSSSISSSSEAVSP